MLQTSLRGAVAGAVATVVMTLEQPLDKRLFDSKYDDVEILGKLVTRGDEPRLISPRTVAASPAQGLHRARDHLAQRARPEVPRRHLETRQIRDRGVWSAWVEPVQRP